MAVTTARPSGAAARRRSHLCQGDRRFRLARIEQLESRHLLSILTVINTSDSGSGSLREKLGLAVAGDTINFDPSLAGGTITLTSGQLSIGTSVHIIGLGANQLTIDGGNTYRVFNVASGVTAAISGLTIAHGNAANYNSGGGIYNYGTLTLTADALTGNNATIGGGGVANYGTLSVNASTFSGNTAYYEGGGICNFSSGTLTATNSTFYGNSAPNNEGGGIANINRATLNQCTIAGNSTNYIGGGFYTNGTATLNNCIVGGNTATTCPNAA